MKMNIKQQYLLRLLGLEKKGALTDFEAFALKGNLDFRKASAVADMLVWYSKEAGIPQAGESDPEESDGCCGRCQDCI